jgi:beta-lactam-binding protein with PASTA domain
MPNVVGMTRDQVNAAMRKAELYYVTRGPNANSTKWTKVVSSVPVAGTEVKWHSTVILNVQ